MTDQQREGLLCIVESRGTLGDRFADIKRIDRKGGSGSFSLVTTAVDLRTKQKVALKFFHPLISRDDPRWAYYCREVEVLHVLSGTPGVVGALSSRSDFTELLQGAHGVVIPVNFDYYALELARGTLERQIAAGPGPLLHSIESFSWICRTVHTLHARGVVHRDLKPSNLLVLPGGRVVVGDFGCSRQSSRTDARMLPDYAGAWPGDLLYTPPEAMAGIADDDDDIARGADMYAMGAIFMELVTAIPLALQVFSKKYLLDLGTYMRNVPVSERRTTYDKVVDAIADANPLPTFTDLGVLLPGSVAQRVQAIVHDMSAVDYRRRPKGFGSVRRQLRICSIILRNEEKERLRLARRRAMRMARSAASPPSSGGN